MRTCSKCGETKELADFYRRGGNVCKVCTCERVRSRRLTDPKVRAYDRGRAKLPHRVARAKRITKNWRERNPDAYKAHCAVNNALRDGKIGKGPCAICAAEKNIHAHHNDYSKPLDVIWLCARCHHRTHALFPQIEGANKSALAQ